MTVQYFGRRVNSRRKASHTSAGSEMNFSENVCRDPSEIVHGWGQYFSKLYSDTKRDHYDDHYDVVLKRRFEQLLRVLSPPVGMRTLHAYW